jgi:hypothetical protein
MKCAYVAEAEVVWSGVVADHIAFSVVYQVFSDACFHPTASRLRHESS